MFLVHINTIIQPSLHTGINYTPVYTINCDKRRLLRHRSCSCACDIPYAMKREEREEVWEKILITKRSDPCLTILGKRKNFTNSSSTSSLLDFFVSCGQNVGPLLFIRHPAFSGSDVIAMIDIEFYLFRCLRIFLTNI